MKIYDGKKDYIFISYCHRDKDAVLPIIERLVSEGYRLWYDEGIEAGTEWPEVVASHLKYCALFIPFLSDEYMHSFNCKREIDYAVQQRKQFIAVYLSPCELSPGMEMQLSGVQSLFRYQMDEETFFSGMYRSGLLDSSRMEPGEAEESGYGNIQGSSREEMGKADDDTAKQTDPPAEAAVTAEDTSQPRRRRMTTRKAILTVAGIIAALILIRIVTKVITTTTIDGQSYSVNEPYMLFKEAEISDSDLKKLAGSRTLSSIGFTDCTFTGDASVLSGSKGEIHSINLTNCSGIDDFSWIDKMELESLTLSGCGLDDTGLAAAIGQDEKKLNHLDISGNTLITDLSPLEECEGLVDLKVSGCPVESLAPASHLTDLYILEASGCGLTSLPEFRDLSSLDQLYLNDNKLTSLNGIESAANLVTLEVSGNDLSDLGGLESVYSLRTLYAVDNELVSIDGLCNCTVLRDVDLGGNRISDVSALSKSMLSLESLILADNELEDMSCLSGLSQLKGIDISSNSIDDLSFLASAIQLQWLVAEHDHISDITPIYNLKNLTHLYLADNEIAGDVRLDGFSELKQAVLQHNQINSLYYDSEGNGHSSYYATLELLAVYDNPLYVIADTSKGENKEINTGMLDWPDAAAASDAGYDCKPLEWGGLFYEMYIVNAPYDERLQIEEINANTEYTTGDHLDEMVVEKRDNWY